MARLPGSLVGLPGVVRTGTLLGLGGVLGIVALGAGLVGPVEANRCEGPGDPSVRPGGRYVPACYHGMGGRHRIVVLERRRRTPSVHTPRPEPPHDSVTRRAQASATRVRSLGLSTEMEASEMDRTTAIRAAFFAGSHRPCLAWSSCWDSRRASSWPVWRPIA